MPVDVRPTLFLFLGLRRDSPVETMLADAYQSIALDTIGRAQETDAFERIVVATNSANFVAFLDSPTVETDVDAGPFHFGRRLRDLVQRYRPRRVFCLGAGSGPLLTCTDLAAAAHLVAESRNTVVSNNYFSADMMGFGPAEAIEYIDPPSNDNDLPFRLVRQAGLRHVTLPRCTGTMFDIDTPTDLAVLRLHPGVGSHARQFLADAPLDTVPLLGVLPVLRDPSRQAVVAGRVNQAVWTRLENDFRCGVRVYAEERGMRASGRQERGEVRSLFGFLLEEVGSYRFFEHLAELGQAAFLDTRVLFHHCHWDPTPSDRFNSDLLAAECIVDPRVREFTQAAAEAPMPVVLGGHSLVSGGLWALADVFGAAPVKEG